MKSKPNTIHLQLCILILFGISYLANSQQTITEEVTFRATEPLINSSKIDTEPVVHSVSFDESGSDGHIEETCVGDYGARISAGIDGDITYSNYYYGYNDGEANLEQEYRVSTSYPNERSFVPGETVTIETSFTHLNTNNSFELPKYAIFKPKFGFGFSAEVDLRACFISCTNFSLIDESLSSGRHAFFSANANADNWKMYTLGTETLYHDEDYSFSAITSLATGLSGTVASPIITDYAESTDDNIYSIDADKQIMDVSLSINKYMAYVVPAMKFASINLSAGSFGSVGYTLISGDLNARTHLYYNYDLEKKLKVKFRLSRNMNYRVLNGTTNAVLRSGNGSDIITDAGNNLEIITDVNFREENVIVEYFIEEEFNNYTYQKSAVDFVFNCMSLHGRIAKTGISIGPAYTYRYNLANNKKTIYNSSWQVTDYNKQRQTLTLEADYLNVHSVNIVQPISSYFISDRIIDVELVGGEKPYQFQLQEYQYSGTLLTIPSTQLNETTFSAAQVSTHGYSKQYLITATDNKGDVITKNITAPYAPFVIGGVCYNGKGIENTFLNMNDTVVCTPSLIQNSYYSKTNRKPEDILQGPIHYSWNYINDNNDTIEFSTDYAISLTYNDALWNNSIFVRITADNYTGELIGNVQHKSHLFFNVKNEVINLTANEIIRNGKTAICSGNDIDLSVNAEFYNEAFRPEPQDITYLWYKNGSYYKSSCDPLINDIEEGSYKLTTTIRLNDFPVDREKIFISEIVVRKPDVFLTASITTNDPTSPVFCDKITLNANANVTNANYQWYKDNVLLPDSLDSLYVLETGRYKLIVTDTFACNAPATSKFVRKGVKGDIPVGVQVTYDNRYRICHYYSRENYFRYEEEYKWYFNDQLVSEYNSYMVPENRGNDISGIYRLEMEPRYNYCPIQWPTIEFALPKRSRVNYTTIHDTISLDGTGHGIPEGLYRHGGWKNITNSSNEELLAVIDDTTSLKPFVTNLAFDNTFAQEIWVTDYTYHGYHGAFSNNTIQYGKSLSFGENSSNSCRIFKDKNFTLELWLKPSEVNQLILFKNYYRLGYNTEYSISILRAGQIEVNIDGNIFQSEGQVHLDEWNYFALVYNAYNRSARLMLNGKAENDIKLNQIFDFGQIQPNSMELAFSDEYRGSIGEIRIWREALDTNVIDQWKNLEISSIHPNWENLQQHTFFGNAGTNESGDRIIRAQKGSEVKIISGYTNNEKPPVFPQKKYTIQHKVRSNHIQPPTNVVAKYIPSQGTSVKDIELSWEPNKQNDIAATGYKIQKKINGTFTQIASVPNTTTSINDTGMYGSTCEYRIVSEYYGIQSQYSKIASVTCGLFSKTNHNFTKVIDSKTIWIDFDGDNDKDLIYGGRNESSEYVYYAYENVDGSFVPDYESIWTQLDFRFEMQFNDYDNDGDLDVLTITEFPDSAFNALTIHTNHIDSFQTKHYFFDFMLFDAMWGDYDNDGDLDVLAGGEDLLRNSTIRLYEQTSNGLVHIDYPVYDGQSYTAFTNLSPYHTNWGDFDNDGDLDIFLTGYDTDIDDYRIQTYRNIGNRTFEEFDPGFPPIEGDFHWGDYNNDNLPDALIVGTDASFGMERHMLIKSTGTNFEVDEAATSLFEQIGGYNVEWVDYDNDNDLDLIYGDQFNGLHLYKNTNSSFTEIVNSGLPSLEYIETKWADYDNDGDLDVFVIGMDYNIMEITTSLYQNNLNLFSAESSVPVILNSSVGISKNRQVKRDDNQYTESKDYSDPTPQLYSAVLEWDALVDSLNVTYNIYLRSSNDTIIYPFSNDTSGIRTISKIGNAGYANIYPINDLSAGIYFWSVQTINSSFVGSVFASEQVLILGDNPPDPAYNLTANWDSTRTKIKLIWDNRFILTDSVILELKIDTASFASLNSIEDSALSYTDSLLNEGSIHTYRIKSVNSYGLSYSNEASITIPAIPQVMLQSISLNEKEKVSIDTNNIHITDIDTKPEDIYLLFKASPSSGNLFNDTVCLYMNDSIRYADIIDNKFEFKHVGNEMESDTLLFDITDHESGGVKEVKLGFDINLVNEAPYLFREFADTAVIEDAEPIIYPDITTYFNDADNDSLTITVLNNNRNLLSDTIIENNLQLNISENEFGIASITLSAYDGEITTDTTITVSVQSINDPPLQVKDFGVYRLAKNSNSFNIDSLSYYFTDIEGDSIVINTAINKTGIINSYSSNDSLYINPINDTIGEVILSVLASDSLDSTTAFIIITIIEKDTIYFDSIPDQLAGADVLPKAVTKSGDLVSYEVVSGNAVVNEYNEISCVGTSTVTIEASCEKQALYSVASKVYQSFNILPATLAVRLDSLLQEYDGTPKQPKIEGVPDSTEMMITFNGDTAKPVNRGVYNVIANIINSSDYSGGDTAVFKITKGVARFSIDSVEQAYDGTPKQAVISSLNIQPIPYEIRYNSLTELPEETGEYTLEITTSDTNYIGSASAIFTITQGEQEINWADIDDTPMSDSLLILTASSTSGLPVSYEVTEGPAYIDENKVIFTDLGTVTMVATQSGNVNYLEADTVTNTFTILKSPITVTVADTTTHNYDGTPKTVEAVASIPDLDILVFYDDSTQAPTEAGEYKVTAMINDSLYSGLGEGLLRIEKAEIKLNISDTIFTFDSLEIVPPIDTVLFGYEISYRVSEDLENPYYEDKPLINAGAYKMVVYANSTNNFGFDSRNITVNKVKQSIVMETIPSFTFMNTSIPLNAYSTSGLSIGYSLNEGLNSLAGDSLLEIKSPGKVLLIATQTGDNNYDTASVVQEFCVFPNKPEISMIKDNEIESTSKEGNCWYKNGILIDSSNSNILKLSESGIYSVKVSIDGCESEFSNDISYTHVTSLSKTTLEETQLMLDPNPARDVINVVYKSNSNKPVAALIIDMKGRQLKEKPLDKKRNIFDTSFDLTDITPGMYFIVITENNNVLAKERFVKK